MLDNGDVIKGEVLELQRGNLRLDTDAMDEIDIDWEDVVRVWSQLFFEVTDPDGLRYFGQLSATAEPRVLLVTLEADTVTLPFESVIELRNVAEGFWAKTSGYVDVGFNLAQANDLVSLLVQGHTTFSGSLWEVDLDGEVYHQSQTSNVETGSVEEWTSRRSASVTGRRFLLPNWAATTSVQTESNDELSLDLRALVSLGARYDIVRSQGVVFYTGASAVFNHERFIGEDTNDSEEVLGTIGYDMFDVGDLDVYAQLQAYKTLGTTRYRLDFSGRVSWEIVDDFTLGLSAVEVFDSAPGDGAERRDFQYSVALGWNWD
jgi:hypothetical protein